MAKDKKPLLFNFSGSINKKLETTEEQRKQILSSRKKINDFLDPTSLNLDPSYTYQIKGASGRDGCAMHKSVTGSLPQKIPVLRSKKRKRRLNNAIDEKIRVIDLAVKSAKEAPI